MNTLDEMIAENEQTVYAFLLSLCHDASLAEELTQETLFRAILKRETFRGDCRLSVWLCQIAKNLYFSWYQKHKNDLPLEESAAAADDHDFTADLADRDCAKQILRILHTLEEPYKEVFMLHVFGGISLTEISRLFHKSESFARVTYFRAKNTIIEKMKEESL